MIKRKFFQFLGLGVLFFLISFWPLPTIQAQEESPSLSCLVYFTGVGCPHCAKADAVVFGEILKDYPGLVIIEYEIYQTPSNAQVLTQYDKAYQLPSWQYGIPSAFFDKSEKGILIGDPSILGNLRGVISDEANPCLLIDGSTENFSQLKLDELPGSPKVWHQDRILVKQKQGNWVFAWNGSELPEKNSTEGNTSQDISLLIINNNFTEKLKTLNYTTLTEPFKVNLSGQEVNFTHAVQLKTEKQSTAVPVISSKLTLAKVASLALVDAVNPCALAVLLLMLTAIMAYNPGSKKKILLAGLAFVASIFVIYFFYGLAIIRLFQLIQSLASVKLWLYRALGALAILLGLFNVKDFFFYKPGGVGTEMPMFLRPKAKKLLSKATSPIGAGVMGILVTVFLLPCTIGPYFIAGGILSSMQVWNTIPWLIFYNFLFVLPMLAIVFSVYGGLSRVKDVSQWKEKNITKIHLVEGLIMLILGGIMVLGLF